jgi:predicted transposase/invertase (TIGR01784 family)
VANKNYLPMPNISFQNSVFVDPLSDFGFKKIFGRSGSTEALKDLLNSLLKLDKPVIAIILITTEQVGDLKTDRKAVFDIHCKDEEGNLFIIEVQKLKEEYFKDRSVFYSTFPIRSQGERGEWNFELKKTYAICILEFCFDDTHPQKVIHEVKLIDLSTKEIFYDRLTFLYVELPKFIKKETELITREDKWLYVLTNLTNLNEMPLSLLGDSVFNQFFMDARKAHLTELELQAYYANKKVEWDEFAIKETAMKDGKAEGKAEAIEEKNAEFVTNLLQNTNLAIEEIARLVSVTTEFVIKIKKAL